MNRRSIWIAAVIVGWMATAALPMFGDDAPPAPDPLKPFAPLIDQAKKYQELTTGLSWQRVYDDYFDPKETPKFTPSVAEVTVTDNNVTKQVPTTRYAKVEGQNVLEFDTQHLPPDGLEAVLAIGPKVSGEFVVEFEAELINDNPSDLSIFAPIHDGPGFQFGGHANSENILTTVAPNAEAMKAAHQHPAIQNPIGNTPLIEKNRFYKVRMEVKDHKVRGFIDDKLIGELPLDPKAWDGKQEVQPEIYTWDSVMRIKSVHVDQLTIGPKDVDMKAAWTKAFGDLKEDDLKKKIDALADLMGDDDQTVRDAAQAMITRLGPLAIPSLKTAIAGGTAEESQRATAVLNSIRQPAPATQPDAEAQPEKTIEVAPMKVEIQIKVNQQ